MLDRLNITDTVVCLVTVASTSALAFPNWFFSLVFRSCHAVTQLPKMECTCPSAVACTIMFSSKKRNTGSESNSHVPLLTCTIILIFVTLFGTGKCKFFFLFRSHNLVILLATFFFNCTTREKEFCALNLRCKED